MSSIPTNLARVPNALGARILLNALSGTQRQVLTLQSQLATGKRVNRASDDAIAANIIGELDARLERRAQRERNLDHAQSVLDTADSALAQASSIVIEAKGIGLSQVGVGSDAETRENQGRVIDVMLNELVNIANRQYQDIFLFGGDATANSPVVEKLGGFRYLGQGDGIVTDLGMARTVPITTSGEEAFGALSTRVEGDRDLDPTMIGSTRLRDLNGARGFGISLGTINANVNGTDVQVDLTGAHTVQDVIDTLQTAIQTVDAGAVVQIDPVTGNRFEILPTLGPIIISDIGLAGPAADLGLDTTFPLVGGTGSDVDPKLTEITPLASLTGVTVPLGTIRLENAGITRDVDLSGATTVRDVMNLVAGADLGIRVEIADTGDRLNFVNELSGGEMSIGEVAGGTTATELGVRSFTTTTLLDDFNDGLGVRIISGSVDPVTGLPDPAADLDFRITIKDTRTFDVDLAGAETVQDVLDAINTAAAGAGIGVPAEFEAILTADGNGIDLVDNTLPGGNPTTVTALNGSFAAEDLGILGTTTGATLNGEDRAKAAVGSVFSHLIALRDALLGDDERGISLATSRLEEDISRLARTRADVGVRSRRVRDATSREEDLRIQETGLKSEVQDLDFTEAAVRFSNLQQQLQAGLLTTSQALSLSLLDFLR